MKIIYFFILFPFSISADLILKCKTHQHIGLNFLGKDYDEILNHMKLKEFDIKLSNTRKRIFEQEKSKFEKKVLPKTSHFLEIVLIKSSGYSIPMHCSWIFDVRNDSIIKGDFSCIGHPKNDRVFSLDHSGNFTYSSNFDEFFPNKKNKTLHSLIGTCK
tara:strand:+ start:1781 stop:2257 length:477 start_codon:yes stop_codon:yes gene_type:complete